MIVSPLHPPPHETTVRPVHFVVFFFFFWFIYDLKERAMGETPKRWRVVHVGVDANAGRAQTEYKKGEESERTRRGNKISLFVCQTKQNMDA